ncbi:hypothetical protein [uncultured Paludibaculum sp.]|uniref:hypothetical protein n=1 Tax=uncultured Paludibaculum sp. TaxID=1765020 RepID=UPI002AAB3B41|nr:hypothetical protein [uncultured Paludibaculum sp.]
MGARIEKGTAVTIDFRERNGSPSTKPPITTQFVEVFGTDRCNVITKGGLNIPADSDLGSADWLTVVAIADSEENLASLKAYLGEQDYCLEHPETSASSYGVAIAECTGDGTIQVTEGCVTLATGKDVIFPPATTSEQAKLVVDVDHIYVFPSGTGMSANSAFGLPWARVAPTAVL